MTGRRLGLLLLILVMGGAVDAAWFIRQNVGVGASGGAGSGATGGAASAGPGAVGFADIPGGGAAFALMGRCVRSSSASRPLTSCVWYACQMSRK